MDKRVRARHFGRFYDDRISGGPSERTTTFDWMTSAIGRLLTGHLPPGPRSRRRILPRSMAAQSVFRGGELLPNSANRYDVAEPQPFVLTFFSV
jgi:hypothetical protein